MRIIIHDPLIREAVDADSLPGVRAEGDTVLIRAAPLGVTPLCWRRIGDTIHLAVQPAQLARLDPVPLPSNSVLQALLTWDFPSDDASPFSGVHRVPGGCQATVSTEGDLLERWWKVAPETDGASSPALLWDALVLQCAHALQGATRGAVMLSGGIDSAAIAAAAVTASRQLDLPMPILLSAAYPGLDCDEQPLQEAVARHLGAPPIVHDGRAVALWPTLAEAVRETHSPLVDGQEGINLGLYRAARDHGCDVVLHGVGGDELFEGRGLEVDLLRGGRWGAAASLIRSGLRSRPGPSLRTWLRRGIRNPLRPTRMGPSAKDRDEAGSWCRAVVRQTLTGPGLDWRLEMAERTSRRAGLRFAAPYLGRRFLEAYERFPSGELASGGIIKGALRAAASPHLPADVVHRVSKVRFAAYYQSRLVIEGDSMRRVYAELASMQELSWLPRQLPSFSRPASPREFLPLWMGLAILLFVGAQSTSTRRID